MTNKQLLNLQKTLNQGFGKPFLPDGFVKAFLNERGSIGLYVGDRYVEINRDGTAGDSGSNVGTGRQWIVLSRRVTLKVKL